MIGQSCVSGVNHSFSPVPPVPRTPSIADRKAAQYSVPSRIFSVLVGPRYAFAEFGNALLAHTGEGFGIACR